MIVLIAVLLAFTSCSQTAVVLWTNVPEIVPAVERFNAAQEEHVVELFYKDELGRALRLAETPPDLVVGTYIEDRATATLMEPLDRLVRRELNEEAFYEDLLATGMRDGRHYLIPVSFNLPLIYFRGEVPDVSTPMIITPEEMQARGEGFNAQNDERYTRIAYSPVWNPAFLYQYLRLLGFTISEGAEGQPEWSFETVVAGDRKSVV